MLKILDGEVMVNDEGFTRWWNDLSGDTMFVLYGNEDHN